MKKTDILIQTRRYLATSRDTHTVSVLASTKKGEIPLQYSTSPSIPGAVMKLIGEKLPSARMP